MTTLYEEKIKCSLCEAENDFSGIGSTNAMGSPDLDTRPPEMQRSTMFAWVQRCPDCGYCASDIGMSRPKAKTVVNTVEYRNQLDDAEYPELAKSFLCKAILDREAREFGDATWALINAAWVCDDAEQGEQATACRLKAAEMLKVAEKERQRVAGEEGAATAILVDLLRRSGKVEGARKVIEEAGGKISVDIIARVLDFQSALLDKADLSCHTIAEALGEENVGP